MMMSKRVCVVIPAFNEGTVIGKVIKDVNKIFDKTSYDVDIVVVNDGSTDSTESQAKNSGAFVISHILNSGAGSATATGLSYAQQAGYNIAVTMDADGQHSPKDVLEGIKLLDSSNNDLIIGSRLIDSTGMSRVKIIGNRGLSLVTKVLFGVKVTDSQSGLRIFSKNALDKLKWKTSGYEFCSEMLWRAKQLNLKIDEFPIKAIYTEYSLSKGQNNWNAFNILKTLIKRRLLELFNE